MAPAAAAAAAVVSTVELVVVVMRIWHTTQDYNASVSILT